MTTILKNSAKCNHCGEEIESKGRHDFVVHYCPQQPKQGMKWQHDGDNSVLVPNGDAVTWNFAVDGGHSYLRRCGDGFTDTSLVKG